MNSKHTPGPWVIERDPSNNTIAVIGPCAAEEYAGFAWLEVSEENARLIAVAPELLEMLQKAVKYGGLFPDLAEEAQTIIAKATGDQS